MQELKLRNRIDVVFAQDVAVDVRIYADADWADMGGRALTSFSGQKFRAFGLRRA